MVNNLIVGDNHSVRQQCAANALGVNADAVVDDDYTGRWRTKCEQFLLFG
jgi:hypothetical protein